MTIKSKICRIVLILLPLVAVPIDRAHLVYHLSYADVLYNLIIDSSFRPVAVTMANSPRGWMYARIGMLRALNHHIERVLIQPQGFPVGDAATVPCSDDRDQKRDPTGRIPRLDFTLQRMLSLELGAAVDNCGV